MQDRDVGCMDENGEASMVKPRHCSQGNEADGSGQATCLQVL